MADQPYTLTRRVRLARRLMRPVFRGVFHLLSRVHLTGLQNIPPRGPYIVAINHISLYEPPFILAFWPVPLEAAGAVDIWERPGQAALARWYGGIPVHRGEYDRALLETMLSALRSGRPLVIAPEGGRSHTPGLRPALPGVAYLVEVARVPVLPVGIVGTTDDFLRRALRFERPQLEMRIGAPLNLPPVEGKGEARRQARQRNADQIMLAIAALLPSEYQGVYTRDAQLAAETPK
jgi:1-acyl-sn-glycerol-3-phosphate acyltransferase